MRLLDFGLAQLAEEEALTATGDVPGTLAYVPPERLKGDSGDPAADVWAVGVMLWEAPRGLASVLERLGARDRAPDRDRRGAARAGSPRPAASLSALWSTGCSRSTRPHAPRRAGSPTSCATRSRSASSADRARRDVSATRVARQLAAPAAAGVFAGWTAATVPFFAASSAPLIGLLAFALTLYRPRLGLAFTLAVPILPLGNISSGSRSPTRGSRASGSRSRGARPADGLVLALGPLARADRRARPAPAGRAGRAEPVRAARSRSAPRCCSPRSSPASATRRSRSPAPRRRRASGSPAARIRSPSRSRSGGRSSTTRRSSSRPSRWRPPPSRFPYARERGLWWIAGFGAAFIVLTVTARADSGRDSACPRGLDDLHRHGREGPELEFSPGRTRPDERSQEHRAKDRRPLRGRLRTRVPHARAAGRARAQARQGDGGPPRRLGLAHLRAERVHGLPRAVRPRAVHELRGLAPRASCRSTSPRTPSASATSCCSPPEVVFETDEDLDMGEFGIATRMVQGATPQPGEPESQPVPGATMVYRPPVETEAVSVEELGLGRELVTLTVNGTKYELENGRARDRALEGLRHPAGGRERLSAPRRGAPRRSRLLGRRPELDQRDGGKRAPSEAARSCARAIASRSARASSSSGATRSDVVTLASIAVTEALLVLKILFLVLLYLFIWRIVRTAAKDVSLPQESFVLAPSEAAALREAAGLNVGRVIVVKSPALAEGEEWELDSAPLTFGRSAQNDIPTRARRVRVLAAREHRAAARRRLRLGRRLDERHVPERRARDRADGARARRRRPHRRDRAEVRTHEASAR